MTAQGEDILAWLNTAITARETAAQHAAISHTDAPRSGSWQQQHDEHHGGYMVRRAARRPGAVTPPLTDAVPERVALVFGESAATHIVLNDPESVLRRCTAERKILKLHSPVVLRAGGGAEYFQTTTVCKSCEPPKQFPETAYPCPTIVALAEGYGWTAGQTPPIEGDQVT